jgi:DNA repair protein RadC
MSSIQRRLREQVQQYGMEGLSDADLITLVLARGTATNAEEAVMQVRKLLAERGGISGVLKMDTRELLEYGFSKALATRLHAILELARRILRPAERLYQILSADDAAALVRMDMMFLDHEEMHVLLLDTKNHVVRHVKSYKGTVNNSVLRASELFRPAVVRNCPHIIVCHNHPSGDPEPSPEDIEVTKQLVEAGKLLDIEILDHIIIGNPRYVSLRERLHW